MSNQRYMQRGVSASKEDVHNAIKNIDKGIFPQAFCKIIPDILGGDPEYCNIMHADGAGTKSSLAYLYWKETGDLSVWKGIAQDALIMNIDDLLCVGAVDNILVSSTIGRNKLLVPGEVISAIINGTDELLAELRDMGVGVYATGGETADVGDLVRTIIVDSTVTCRMKRADVINNANIRPGDVIVGLASYGKATYEKEYNGGMGSNGLTSARHDVFSKYLAEKYPESYDKAVPEELVYSGNLKLTDKVEGQSAGCRQVGFITHSHIRSGSEEAVGCTSSRNSRYGSLLRRCTDQDSALCRQSTCSKGQPVPRSPSVQNHQGTKRHRLGRNVQGIQYGPPSGSLPVTGACRRSNRYQQVVQYRRTNCGTRRRKRQERIDYPLRVWGV